MAREDDIQENDRVVDLRRPNAGGGIVVEIGSSDSVVSAYVIWDDGGEGSYRIEKLKKEHGANTAVDPDIVPPGDSLCGFL